MANSKNKDTMTIVHSIIGVAIMVLFRYLPLNLPEITPVGMQVVGIFLGTLYLWTFVDPLWSSLFAIAMVGFSDYAPMNAVLQSAFGSPGCPSEFLPDGSSRSTCLLQSNSLHRTFLPDKKVCKR